MKKYTPLSSDEIKKRNMAAKGIINHYGRQIKKHRPVSLVYRNALNLLEGRFLAPWCEGGYTYDEICRAIDLYALCLGSPRHWVSKRWDINIWLEDRLETFMEENNPLVEQLDYKVKAEHIKREALRKKEEEKRRCAQAEAAEYKRMTPEAAKTKIAELKLKLNKMII